MFDPAPPSAPGSPQRLACRPGAAPGAGVPPSERGFVRPAPRRSAARHQRHKPHRNNSEETQRRISHPTEGSSRPTSAHIGTTRAFQSQARSAITEQSRPPCDFRPTSPPRVPGPVIERIDLNTECNVATLLAAFVVFWDDSRTDSATRICPARVGATWVSPSVRPTGPRKARLIRRLGTCGLVTPTPRARELHPRRTAES
jgi:hypothetical protein